MSKIDEIWMPLPLENPRETCIAKGTPKVIKNDVEKPSIWRSSKNQLFDSHNDHDLDASEPLKSQRMLYNKRSLKNVCFEEQKELGACTGQEMKQDEMEITDGHFRVTGRGSPHDTSVFWL